MKQAPRLPCRSGKPGQTTPDRLIEAVERLMTERDDLEPSLREITSSAGANVAAVNYHFGSKDALVHAVIERALTEHAREQLEGLDACARSQPPAGIEEIVWAWMRPALVPADGERPTLFARLTSRAASGRSPGLRQLGDATHAASHARFYELLSARLPDLPAGELTFRIAMAASSLAGIIVGAFADAVVAGNPSAARCDESVRRAIAFITGGLAAPPVTQPVREAGRDPRRPPLAATMNDVHPDTQRAP